MWGAPKKVIHGQRPEACSSGLCLRRVSQVCPWFLLMSRVYHTTRYRKIDIFLYYILRKKLDLGVRADWFNPQAHAGAIASLADEFNASGSQVSRRGGGISRLTSVNHYLLISSFVLLFERLPDFSAMSQTTPSQSSSSHLDLFYRHH